MTQPAASELRVGSVLRDTYEITSLLGKGGMGAVFLARHRRLPGKQIAVKVLLGGAHLPEEIYARFRREAEITSRLGHPNIVEMVDFDTMEDGTPFLVMEYLRGESLEQRLVRGPLSVPEMMSLTRQIGSGLAAAHRAGVVHRDLKPANVFLVPTDAEGTVGERVKLLDFGISKMLASQTLQTQEAVLMGTPQYMSPEQALGKNSEIDARTDLFALGCIVYEMLSGRPPFAGEGSSLIQVVFRIVHAQPEPLATLCPHVPTSVIAAVERALSKNAADRPADISTFISELTGSPLLSLSGQAMSSSAPAARGAPAVATGRFGEDDLGSTHMPSTGTARLPAPGDDAGFAATHMPGAAASAPPIASGTARFGAPGDDAGFAATHMPGTAMSAPLPTLPPNAPAPSAPPVSSGTARLPAPGDDAGLAATHIPRPAVNPPLPAPAPPAPPAKRSVSKWAVGGGWAVAAALVVGGLWWKSAPSRVDVRPLDPPPRAAVPTRDSGLSTQTPTPAPPNAVPAPLPPPEPTQPPTAAAEPTMKSGNRPERPSTPRASESEALPPAVREDVRNAEQALESRDTQEALRLTQKANRTRPSAEAFVVMIKSYCLDHNLTMARPTLRKAKSADLLNVRQLNDVKRFCDKNGIEL